MRSGVFAGYTALHCAAAARAPEAVAALLRAGADFHIAYSWIVGEDSAIRGMTPLHMAAAQGNKEVVLLLLKAQAQGLGGRRGGRDIRNRRDAYNLTPADKALRYDHKDVAKLLQPDADIGGLLEGVQSLIEPTRTLKEIAGLAHHAHLQKALEAAAGSFEGQPTVQLGPVQKQHKEQNQCHKQQQQQHSELKQGDGGLMLRANPTMTRSPSAIASGATRVTVSVTSDTGDKLTQVTPGDEGTCPVCLDCIAPCGTSGVELLPCRHELCAACAKGIWQHVDARVTVMSCPMCRSHVAGVKGTAR